MTILLASHLAHQSKQRMPLFLANPNANYGLRLWKASLQNLARILADFDGECFVIGNKRIAFHF